jgi:hypothetical protein
MVLRIQFATETLFLPFLEKFGFDPFIRTNIENSVHKTEIGLLKLSKYKVLLFV